SRRAMGGLCYQYGLWKMCSGLPDRRAVHQRTCGGRNGKASSFSDDVSADEGDIEMSRRRLATVWADGCSGCHMSFLDIDERLLALADQIDLVYSPLVDRKDFPDDVDITLVEGAISSES